MAMGEKGAISDKKVQALEFEDLEFRIRIAKLTLLQLPLLHWSFDSRKVVVMVLSIRVTQN